MPKLTGNIIRNCSTKRLLGLFCNQSFKWAISSLLASSVQRHLAAVATNFISNPSKAVAMAVLAAKNGIKPLYLPSL
jgi:hypothetical protein